LLQCLREIYNTHTHAHTHTHTHKQTITNNCGGHHHLRSSYKHSTTILDSERAIGVVPYPKSYLSIYAKSGFETVRTYFLVADYYYTRCCSHKSPSFSNISSLSINSLTIRSLALIFSSCLNFSSPSIFFFPVDAARAFRFLRASLALYSLMRLS
jgi:hypothetical protein